MQVTELTLQERRRVGGFCADLFRLSVSDQLLKTFATDTSADERDRSALLKLGVELDDLLEKTEHGSLMVARIIQRHPNAVENGLASLRQDRRFQSQLGGLTEQVEILGGASGAYDQFLRLSDALAADRPGVADEITRLARGEDVDAGFPSVTCDIAGGLMFGGLATMQPELVLAGAALGVIGGCF